MSFSLMHSRGMRVLWALFAVLAVLGVACGGGGSTTTGSAGETSGTSENGDATSTNSAAAADAEDTTGAISGDATGAVDEAPTAIPDPTATPAPTAIPETEPTATPAPTATPEPIEAGDDDARSRAIAEIMADEEMAASNETASCMVDGVHALLGTYEPDDSEALNPQVQEVVVTCMLGSLLEDDVIMAPMVEMGYTETEAECIAEATRDALSVASETGAADDVALANEMNKCATPVGPAAGEPAPGLDADLDALWENCTGGSGADCQTLYATSPIGSDYEMYGQTCGGQVVARIDCGLYLNDEAINADGLYEMDEVPAPGSPAPGEDPELDALWDLCNAEDGEACDALFFESPLGSVYESYGFTCGGRVEAESCTGLFGDVSVDSRSVDAVPDPGSEPPGEDAVLDELWVKCSAEDADACDTLYFDSPLGSVYEGYGFTCGGRTELADCSEFFAEDE